MNAEEPLLEAEFEEASRASAEDVTARAGVRQVVAPRHGRRRRVGAVFAAQRSLAVFDHGVPGQIAAKPRRGCIEAEGRGA